MDYKNLFLSFTLAILVYLFYKFHKWWLNGREDITVYSKESTRLGKVKHWTIIIGLVLASAICFFKALV
ncbi:hypothetical protein D3C87_231150 [compost metagenome]